MLVAHELGPLAPLVSRAVLMRDGRIVSDGPPLADHGLPQRTTTTSTTTTRHDHGHAVRLTSPIEGGTP